MKKLIYLIVLALILGLVLTGCSLLSDISQVPATEQSGITYLTKHTANEPQVTPLLAGQTINVGTVSVWNDDVNLYVKYKTTGGWEIAETHLHVALSKDGIPHTNKGNPIPGHFDNSMCHDPWVTEYTYSVSLGDWGPCDKLYIAAHAVVKRLNEDCIYFENYSEKDSVITEPTPNGPVNFYMTDNVPLKSISVGGYADLAPEVGKFPVVAAPGTTPGYENIVAFTIFGDYSRDDVIDDDGGTGAGGNTLTDPQDLTQIPLMYHAYSQGLAIVIDVSSIDAVQGLDLAAIDLDHNEEWYFLYFNTANELIYKTKLTGSGTSGDGEAFAVEYPNPVSKIAIWGGMNQGVSEVVGYAIDNVCVTSLEEETAWGYGERFIEKGNWATYFTYTVQQLMCPCIFDYSDNIEVLDPIPTDVSVEALVSDEKIRVWKEFEGTLTEDLYYDLDESVSARSYLVGNTLPELYIPLGTQVCIYYVHYDQDGVDWTESGGINASITFCNDILGLIISGGTKGVFAYKDLMFAADDSIGNPMTTYPDISNSTNHERGFDVRWVVNTDDAVFNGDTVDFNVWVAGAHDSFRVILPMVPVLCEE